MAKANVIDNELRTIGKKTKHTTKAGKVIGMSVARQRNTLFITVTGDDFEVVGGREVRGFAVGECKNHKEFVNAGIDPIQSTDTIPKNVKPDGTYKSSTYSRVYKFRFI